MSTLSDSTEITPGQGSFRSLNITVNSILPAGNESFLPCVPNHSAPIFSLFEVQTVCGPGIHLILWLSQTVRIQTLCLMEARECEPRKRGKWKSRKKKLFTEMYSSPVGSRSHSTGPGFLFLSRSSVKGTRQVSGSLEIETEHGLISKGRNWVGPTTPENINLVPFKSHTPRNAS